MPNGPADTPSLPFAQIGIIDAGTIRGGIAVNFLNVGLPVTIVEARAAALERGVETIRKDYENTAERGRLTQKSVEKRMTLQTGNLSLASLADCELIMEAVFEDMGVKKPAFEQLDVIAKPGAIQATNTSHLNVNEVASTTRRPESEIGLHYFSPANVTHCRWSCEGTKPPNWSSPCKSPAKPENRRAGRRVPGLCQQPHVGIASARGEAVGRADALGPGPVFVRLWLPNRAVCDARPGRAKPGLDAREIQRANHARNIVRARSALPVNLVPVISSMTLSATLHPRWLWCSWFLNWGQKSITRRVATDNEMRERCIYR